MNVNAFTVDPQHQHIAMMKNRQKRIVQYTGKIVATVVVRLNHNVASLLLLVRDMVLLAVLR